jgi:hypothetical protein
MTILSCHVEGKRTEELNSRLMVEIKSATDISKIESVFPLPLSNFFQVKDLPRGKHLLQLRSSLPSSTHKFESEIIEIDLEKNAQIHVGPLRYKVVEDHHKQVCFALLSACYYSNISSNLVGYDLEICRALILYFVISLVKQLLISCLSLNEFLLTYFRTE